MGGSQAGEVASRLAVQTVIQMYRDGTSPDPLDDIFHAVEAANHVVHAQSVAHPEMSGMGTTCTAVVVRGADTFVAHVGDSRVYLAQGGKLRQLSQDHSLVAQLVRDGQLTAEQARSDPRRNVVTRSVGVGAQVEVDAQRFAGLLREGDTLLMCSDGLHGLVNDGELLEVAGTPELDEGCRRAIALANDRGGHDNITVILARKNRDGTRGSSAEVENRGARANAWADADHDRKDLEHTHMMPAAQRPAAERMSRTNDEDDDGATPRARRVPRALAIEDDAPSRKRTVMWLLIVLVLLLLSIGAAAFVLVQINRQSSALGMNGDSAGSASSWL
jgi:protein phosphatase